MLLASGNILGPVTGMSFLVVEETTDAKLLSSGSVPASPIASTASLMSEDTIKPIAVLSGDWRVWNVKRKVMLSFAVEKELSHRIFRCWHGSIE